MFIVLKLRLYIQGQTVSILCKDDRNFCLWIEHKLLWIALQKIKPGYFIYNLQKLVCKLHMLNIHLSSFPLQILFAKFLNSDLLELCISVLSLQKSFHMLFEVTFNAFLNGQQRHQPVWLNKYICRRDLSRTSRTSTKYFRKQYWVVLVNEGA